MSKHEKELKGLYEKIEELHAIKADLLDALKQVLRATGDLDSVLIHARALANATIEKAERPS